jgi:hypothetical protein
MFRRLFCSLLLVATGCTSLQPVARPAEFVSLKQPQYVLVTTAELEDGEDPILVERPRIQDGRLVGYVYGDPTQLPVEQIRVMQAKQYSRRKTTIAIVGGTLVLGTLGFIIANQGKKIDETYCPPPRCENFPH